MRRGGPATGSPRRGACAGSYATVRGLAWGRGPARRPSPGDGHPGPGWAPGTTRGACGSLAAVVAGRGPGPEPPAPRRSRSRRCVATGCEGAGRFCEGLAEVLGPVGGVPRAVALGDVTEAGRMPFGRAAESRPSPRTRARCRLGPRSRDPRSGDEGGSVGDAVGFLRRNLLVPVPSVASVDGPDARLRVGCERADPASRDRSGEPTTGAFPADFAAMMSLPGVRFDSVRWLGARSDERGYARAGGDPCCAGPAWHDRGLVVGVRASGVDMLADRSRRVATPPGRRGAGPSEEIGRAHV